MEQQGKQTVSKVSGDRTFIETHMNYLSTIIVWAASGAILGINLGQWIVTKYPANHAEITAAVIIGLVLFQFGWLTKQFIKMRRWKKDLNDERIRLIEDYAGKVDALLPNDPVQAARLKMAMEESWPKP